MQWPWRKAESDLEREVRHHLAELAAQYEAQGLTAREAWARAQREFGSTELIKDQCRDESRWQWLAELRQDVTFGWRMMKTAPLVTLAAVLSLALGIGANTAIVSLMDLVLWRSLPVAAPEQLSLVHWTGEEFPEGLAKGGAGSMHPDPAGGHVADFFAHTFYRRAREVAADLAEIAPFFAFSDEVSTSYKGHAAVVHQRPVGGNFLRALGVRPHWGRLLTDADDAPGAPPVCVVSHRYFMEHLGGNASAVGQPLRVSNASHIIVGVLPPGFYGLDIGDRVDLYTPMRHSAAVLSNAKFFDFNNAENWFTAMIARRKPGVTPAQVQARLAAAFPGTWLGQPKSPKHTPHVRLDPGVQGVGGLQREFKRPLYVLAALVSLVLLIACANIANLLLARGEARAKELALRLSLGCSRSRLLRQLLTESAMLAALGGAMSLAFASATANLLARLAPAGHGIGLFDVQIDSHMIVFALVATVLTTLLFGLYPAWRASRLDLNNELKQNSGRLGRLLVTAQVALTVILVASAALFARNLQKVQSIDAGFNTSNLILFGVYPGQSGYQGDKLANFYRETERRLKELPGVTQAGLSHVALMTGGGHWEPVIPVDGGKRIDSGVNMVTPGFLLAQGVKLRAGRLFTEADATAKQRVAIVSEEIARQMGEPVLGRRVRLGDDPARPMLEVVGVAASARYDRLTNKIAMVYLPADGKHLSMTALVRTSMPPAAAMRMIQESMRGLDRDLPLVEMKTLEAQIAEVLRRERLFAFLCGGFGALALLLSTVGLYGVIAYSTTRRRREMGVRMALGATRGRLVAMIVREGTWLVLLGLLAGMPFVYWGAEAVRRELFELSPFDPLALGGGAAVLLSATLLAAFVPAWRASRLNPQEALRRE